MLKSESVFNYRETRLAQDPMAGLSSCEGLGCSGFSHREPSPRNSERSCGAALERPCGSSRLTDRAGAGRQLFRSRQCFHCVFQCLFFHYSGFRVDATQPPRCVLYRGPSKPPFGDCAIYSETTVVGQNPENRDESRMSMLRLTGASQLS